MLALSLTAVAKPIMYTMNDGGGKIVLTDENCKRGMGKVAYSTHPTARTQLGCWTADDLAVHIQWNGNDLRSYDYEGWYVIENKGKTAL